MKSDNASHPVVPEEDRCVWMSAGILSYHLCELKFDCDRCPLDAAMRMHFPREGSGADVPPGKQENCLYSPNHCWVKIIDHAVARVGLEPRFASLLISPKAIVLPSIGSTVRRHEYCSWIVLEGGILPISSPVDGTIVSTNARVTDAPLELRFHPMTRGWLFEMRPSHDVLSTVSLMKEAAADKRFADDLARFNRVAGDALRGAAVGATMADGGQVLQDLAGMLGPKRYFSILRDTFGEPGYHI